MRVEVSPGVGIEYERTGQGRPVVFLHAFPLNAHMWAGQFEALSAEFDCIALNTRGFNGSSPFDDPPSIEQIARDARGLLDALDISEPIVLCGLSMGGYAAQRFAHEFHERLRGLVLCDTRAEPDSDEARIKRNENIAITRKDGQAALAERMIPALLGPDTRENNTELVERVRHWGKQQSVETLVDALEALRDRPDTTAWLPSITVPTLLVFGEDDALAPPEAIEKLVTSIPNSTLVKIPDAGHLPNLEQPEAYNKALLEFLNSLD